MELVLMLLAAVPIGFFVRNRTAAFLAYIALHAYVFTFQSLTLLIDWAGGSDRAFGPFPDASTGDVFSYGLVNLAIYAVGLGLVYLGGRLGTRRRARASGPVALDPTGGLSSSDR
jgi:hypothetical protein